MPRVTLADAKTHLSALVEQAAQGAQIRITRRGKEIAQIAPLDRPLKPVNVAAMRALTDGMPEQSEPARDWVRRMRDEERF